MTTKLTDGVRQFREGAFADEKDRFAKLAGGQQPETLFITCSDSRIDPNLLTQTKPGELFVIRNAGNIVPPYDAGPGGEAATIEYAVRVLKVKNIVVCGHSHCGAVSGLMALDTLGSLPTVQGWLKHADKARQRIENDQANLEGDARINAAIKANVLVQLENLRTHPSVAEALADKQLTLHGWVYRFETGDVFACEKDDSKFLTINLPSGKASEEFGSLA